MLYNPHGLLHQSNSRIASVSKNTEGTEQALKHAQDHQQFGSVYAHRNDDGWCPSKSEQSINKTFSGEAFSHIQSTAMSAALDWLETFSKLRPQSLTYTFGISDAAAAAFGLDSCGMPHVLLSSHAFYHVDSHVSLAIK